MPMISSLLNIFLTPHLLIDNNHIMIITDFRYFKRISFGQRNTCCCENGTVVLTLRYSSQFGSSGETRFTLQVLYGRTLQSIVTFLLFNVYAKLKN